MGRGRGGRRAPRGAAGGFPRGCGDHPRHESEPARSSLRGGLRRSTRLGASSPESPRMAVSVNPTLPVIAFQGVDQGIDAGTATSALALQAGAVVNAQVLKVADNLVQIAIAGLTVDVLSDVPLTAGQDLQLSVSQSGDGAIRLAIVGQGQGTGTTAAPAGIADTVSLTPNAPLNATTAT